MLYGNSVDPDQLASSEAWADLDIEFISGFILFSKSLCMVSAN